MISEITIRISLSQTQDADDLETSTSTLEISPPRLPMEAAADIPPVPSADDLVASEVDTDPAPPPPTLDTTAPDEPAVDDSDDEPEP